MFYVNTTSKHTYLYGNLMGHQSRTVFWNLTCLSWITTFLKQAHNNVSKLVEDLEQLWSIQVLRRLHLPCLNKVCFHFFITTCSRSHIVFYVLYPIVTSQFCQCMSVIHIVFFIIKFSCIPLSTITARPYPSPWNTHSKLYLFHTPEHKPHLFFYIHYLLTLLTALH